MAKNWTIEALRTTDDLSFAVAILNERLNKLSNPYSPLAEKLKKSIATIENAKERGFAVK